jgi:thiol:disulfide interchange protein DsbA
LNFFPPPRSDPDSKENLKMKRRDFALACSAVLAPAAWAQTTTPAQVMGRLPQAGKEYLPLDKPAPVDTPAGRVEVVEFFWYNCPHCNSFEPALDAWMKRTPKDVSVRRVPVAFHSSFAPQQRLYYALEAMGLVERLHAKVFYAIHVERKRLEKPEVIIDWVAAQGVDQAKFTEHFNSFSTNSKATRATQLMTAYRVEGVPAMGVAGRFYTDGTLAKGMEHVLQVVDYLVGEVRKGR